LAGFGPAEVQLEGTSEAGLVLPDDVAPVASSGRGSVEPWAALLPALDSTVMGWANREWFLGDKQQQAPLFDRSGNAGPTVWWDGQVVGGWAQRKDGSIAVAILRDVGADAREVIGRAAERLRLMIGEVRITPRFRTPLERELAG
jgi:hypothetical protein